MMIELKDGTHAHAVYVRHITVKTGDRLGKPNITYAVYRLTAKGKGREVICRRGESVYSVPTETELTETELLYGYTAEEMQNLVVRPFRQVTSEDVLIGQIRGLTQQYRSRPASSVWYERKADFEKAIQKLLAEVGQTALVMAELDKLEKQKVWWESNMARVNK